MGLVSCVTVPDEDQDPGRIMKSLDAIVVSDSGDQVKIEVDAGKPITYALSTSEGPPRATVDLPGLSRGASLQRILVDKPPVVEVVPLDITEPRPGVRLQFTLSASVKPTVHNDGTKLRIEFPKSTASTDSLMTSTEKAVELPPLRPMISNDSPSRPQPEDLKPQTSRSEPATMLSRVEVRRGEGEATVVIMGDGQFDYDVKLLDKTRLVLDVADVSSSLRLHVLPVDHPVLKQIRIGNHSHKVRLVFDLPKPATYVLKPGARSLEVHLTAIQQSSKPELRLPASSEPDRPLVSKADEIPQVDPSEDKLVRVVSAGRVPFPERLARLEPTPNFAQMAPEAKGSDPTPVLESDESAQPRYVGRRISLDFQAADISNVLRLIAEVSGFNIVVGESVKAKVTMKLVSVPWDQALDMLLKMNNLGKIREGNIIWIDTLANIARQQDEEARAKDAKSKAQDLVVDTIYVRNVVAQELMTTLQRYISPRGQLNANVATNALVIRDTPDSVLAFKRLVDGLDLQSPQILIEARIVQADTNYTRSLGVQWGVRNLTQLSGASNTVANFQSGNSGPFGGQVSDFLVNLPASPIAGAAGFTIGRVLGNGALLDMRLSAGEQLGLTKVLAAPKITTLDKREAKITQGESIPFQTTSLQGTQTTFVDANLELQVTPQITSRDPKEQGKLVLLRIRATRNAVGPASNPQAGPSILRREATTQIMVRDGETTVIGGIFQETAATNVNAVPYLSRIPVIGWFFKQKTETVTKQELLIFLTPNIVAT
jgi:type IV pilus assembly protein PilQ